VLKQDLATFLPTFLPEEQSEDDVIDSNSWTLRKNSFIGQLLLQN
jgi:hypothetical protein